jgi:hypothetical protein
MLSEVQGVAADAAGNIYIADTNNNVIRVVSNGVISTFAGNGSSGYSGDSGPASAAQLNSPNGVAVDAAGNVYIADTGNNVIREVTKGVINTIAGNGALGSSGDYGPATSARLNLPQGMAVDAAGNVYIADTGNNTIRKVSKGVISTIAGTGSIGYSGDAGPALSATLSGPTSVAVDASGTVYVADSRNNVIRTLVQLLPGQAASVAAAAGSGTLAVNVPAGVSWTAVSNEAWITISGGASGTGSGTLTFTIQPDSGAARSGTISIAGQTFTISQEGPPPAGLSLAGSLAQVASAGGWDTSLTLVNLGATSAEARLNVFADDGTTPWFPFSFPQQPSQGTTLGSTFDESIAPGALLLMDTTGPASQAVTTGSGQLLTSGGLDGFAIFELQASGQQAVVPLETRNAASYLLAFDNTSNLLTGLALANLSANAASVKVVVRDDTGAVVPTAVGSIQLAANGHTSFLLNDATKGFPEIAGKRGTVEFDTPSGGQISVLGLRANGKAITTLPVLAQVGTTGGALAQVATGGGWETGFTIVNTGTSAASFTLNFYDATTGAALPLTVDFPQTGTVQLTASVTQTLAAGATALIQTQGGGTTVTCSAELTTTGPVSGFAIFRIQGSGQEAVVPLEARTPNSFVLAYDNTNTLETGVAVANVSAQAASVPVAVYDDTGTMITNGQIQLAGNGHTSFLLTDELLGFPVTAGKRGTVVFQTPSGGRISVLGLRAIGSVITTIPVMTK